MKLITEFTENDTLKCLVEKREDGEKKYVIEGVFAQADKKNRNGRVYPKPIMEKAVKQYVTDTQVRKEEGSRRVKSPRRSNCQLG